MELDSGLATTNSGKLQVILDFAQKGLFGDVANDPKLRNELLSRVGLAGATAIEDIDESRAETENAKMSIGDFDGIMIAQPDPEQGITPDSEILSNDPFFKLDNNEIHAETHRRFILSDEFSELDPKIQEFVVLHQDAHNQQVQASRKNAIDPTRDAREFLQLDKLISLTPNESKQVKQLYLGIEPDEDQEVTGSVTSVDMLNYKKEMNLKTLDGMNKLRTEMMKNAVRPKESKGRV